MLNFRIEFHLAIIHQSQMYFIPCVLEAMKPSRDHAWIVNMELSCR